MGRRVGAKKANNKHVHNSSAAIGRDDDSGTSEDHLDALDAAFGENALRVMAAISEALALDDTPRHAGLVADVERGLAAIEAIDRDVDRDVIAPLHVALQQAVRSGGGSSAESAAAGASPYVKRLREGPLAPLLQIIEASQREDRTPFAQMVMGGVRRFAFGAETEEEDEEEEDEEVDEEVGASSDVFGTWLAWIHTETLPLPLSGVRVVLTFRDGNPHFNNRTLSVTFEREHFNPPLLRLSVKRDTIAWCGGASLRSLSRADAALLREFDASHQPAAGLSSAVGDAESLEAQQRQLLDAMRLSWILRVCHSRALAFPAHSLVLTDVDHRAVDASFGDAMNLLDGDDDDDDDEELDEDEEEGEDAEEDEEQDEGKRHPQFGVKRKGGRGGDGGADGNDALDAKRKRGDGGTSGGPKPPPECKQQ